MAQTTASIHLKADMEHLPAEAVQGLRSLSVRSRRTCLVATIG